MLKNEIFNFKLLFAVEGVQDQKKYFEDLCKHLEEVNNLVKIVKIGLINVPNIEVHRKLYFQDVGNKQTLIDLNVLVTLEADFESINKDKPNSVNNLYKYIEGYLNSFNPFKNVKKKKVVKV